MQYSKKHRCIFVHIPKAAGSSIEQSSIFDDRREEANNKYAATGHTPIKNFKKNLGEAFDGCLKFTFVRNPYSRLYSAYRFLQKGGLNPDDAKIFNTFPEDVRNDFNEFVGFLNIQHINSILHIKPQYSFVTDNENKIPIDFIGKLETFNEDCIKLSKLLNYEFEILHRNKTNYKPVKMREVYSRSSEKVVRSFYEKDFQNFGYNCSVDKL